MIESVIEWAEELPEIGQGAIVIIAAFVVAEIIMIGGRRLIPHDESSITAVVLEEIYMPLYVSAVMIGVNIGGRIIFPGELGFAIGAGALSVVVVVWTRAAIRIGSRVVDLRDDDTFDFGPVIENLWTFFLIIAAFFVLLSVWRVDITPILASAGVLGIVLGYAARDTIANFAAGISLYFDRTFAVGDLIQLPSGERGTVIDISIRSTTILTRDNITVTIPNSEFNHQRVINESAPQRRRRIRLDVSVAYGSDLAAVEEAMLAVAEEAEIILETPKPEVQFREFGDSGILAQLRCHINHPASLNSARDDLIREVNTKFAEAGIKIPFPQRELTFIDSGNEIVVDSPDDYDDATND